MKVWVMVIALYGVWTEQPHIDAITYDTKEECLANLEANFPDREYTRDLNGAITYIDFDRTDYLVFGRCVGTFVN